MEAFLHFWSVIFWEYSPLQRLWPRMKTRCWYHTFRTNRRMCLRPNQNTMLSVSSHAAVEAYHGLRYMFSPLLLFFPHHVRPSIMFPNSEFSRETKLFLPLQNWCTRSFVSLQNIVWSKKEIRKSKLVNYAWMLYTDSFITRINYLVTWMCEGVLHKERMVSFIWKVTRIFSDIGFLKRT